MIVKTPAPVAARRPLSISRRAKLAVEAVGLYVEVRWLLMRGREIASILVRLRGGRAPQSSAPATGEQLALSFRLGYLVERWLGYLPGDTRCLTRSLVLVALLARRNVLPKLVIGARVAPRFGAHAWVELDEHALSKPIEPGGQRLAEL